MPVWDETDLVEFFEVLPEVDDEWGITHTFTIERDGLRPQVTILQYAGEIGFLLYRDGVDAAVLKLQLVECPGVRRMRDKSGDYLEFAAAKVFSGRYDGIAHIPAGIRLHITPHIRLELFHPL